MVRKYARLLEERHTNEKTNAVWSIKDVPSMWQEDTKAKVISDGYVFKEDGTAIKAA